MLTARYWIPAILGVMVCAPIAAADAVVPIVRLDVVQNGVSVWQTDSVRDSTTLTPMPDGSFVFSGASDIGIFRGTLEAVTDPNPGFALGLFITNGSTTAATYEFSFSIEVGPLLAPTVMSGSIAGAIRDGSVVPDGGTLSSVARDSVYTALIDRSPVRTLLRHPFSVTAPLGGAASFGPVAFTDEVGPAVAGEIGIRNRLTLSAGDTARITSTFLVTPEPASLALLVFGSLALFLPRRRADEP